MDPLVQEKFNSVFTAVDMLLAVQLGMGTVVVAVLIGMLVMYMTVMNRLSDVQSNISAVQSNINQVETNLKTEMSGLKTEMSDLKTEMSDLKTEMSNLNDSLTAT